jgi:hypothetical protein
VFFCGGKFYRQRSVGHDRSLDSDESETQTRIALCITPDTLCRSPVHRGIRLAGVGWSALARGYTSHGCGVHVVCAEGLLPFLLPLSVLLFEPDAKSRRRMLPFLVVGCLTALYILWALIAYPTQTFIKANTIVYINPATNNTAVAVLYVMATCGSLLFSKVKDMVIFGLANLTILLVVMAVKRYAFTSLWCAYAAVASVIILAYFWKSQGERPFRYLEAM